MNFSNEIDRLKFHNHTFVDDDSLVDIELIIRFIPAVIIFSITFLFGVVGNIFVILIINSYKKLHNNTNVFLLSLASADLLLIIVCVPLKFIEFFAFEWTLGEVLCKLMHFVQNVSLYCSVLNLTAISIERYIAIIHPFETRSICTRSRTRKIVISIWIASVIAASPLIFGKGIMKLGLDPIDICYRLWKTPYHQIYELFRATLILFLPMIIMVFAYTKILLALKSPLPQGMRKNSKSSRKSSQLTTLRSDTESLNGDTRSTVPFHKYSICLSRKGSDCTQPPRQLVKMLITIIIMYFICWFPLTINNILVAFSYLPSENIGYLWHIRIYASLLSYFNSCINPIVYAFMSKNFRDGFKYLITKGKCERSKSTQQKDSEARYDVLNEILMISSFNNK